MAMISFQVGAVMAKHLFPLMGAQGATALRLGMGAVVLLTIKRPWQHQGVRTGWRWLLSYGCALGLMNLCYYMSIQTLPLGIAIALEFIGPLAVALLGSRRLLDFVWVALVVVGLVLLLPWQAQAQALDPVGVLYALGAAVFWAAYLLVGRRAGVAFGGDAVALGTLLGALVVVPVGVWHAGSSLISVATLPYALGIAVFSSALPYTLEMIALTRLRASTIGLLMSMEPAIGALFGLVFLHEQLTGLQCLAIVAIMVASAGTALGVRGSAQYLPQD